EADALSNAGVRAPAFVVPNSLKLRPRALTARRNCVRKAFGISESAPLLLFVGRFHRVKRLDVAVAMLGALPSAYLVLAGPDEQNLEPILRKQAVSYQCANRLFVLPMQSENSLDQLYAAADLFVLPSEMESFGMAAAEAMSAGLPVLVADKVAVGQWAVSA